jgi:uncharacterized damage-inducible protein DinB
MAAMIQLFDHLRWADALILAALRASRREVGDAVREFAHVIGAEEVWLARLEGRGPRAAVWPVAALAELDRLMGEVHAGYVAFLATLAGDDLGRGIRYANSAGREFSNAIADILVHVALHGQYHRGKINLMLRRAGESPAPADYIAFVRGVAAARSGPKSSH